MRFLHIVGNGRISDPAKPGSDQETIVKARRSRGSSQAGACLGRRTSATIRHPNWSAVDRIVCQSGGAGQMVGGSGVSEASAADIGPVFRQRKKLRRRGHCTVWCAFSEKEWRRTRFAEWLQDQNALELPPRIDATCRKVFLPRRWATLLIKEARSTNPPVMPPGKLMSMVMIYQAVRVYTWRTPAGKRCTAWQSR